jgi:CRP/FNR family transcriptional regulator, cyclic AMP receptor protein
VKALLEVAAGGYPRRMANISVLEAEPDLAEGLEGAALTAATRACRARAVEVRSGRWQPAFGDDERYGFGLLLLSGVLCRQVIQSECSGAELIGPGDLLRPWDRYGEFSTLPTSSQWTVLERAQLALLDRAFARRAAPFPEIASNLTGRALLRSRYLAITSAIVSQRRVDKRLTMLFWHLADRFGQKGSDGVHIPLALTHRTISELIAARRPSVTTALARLQKRGVLERVGRGWLLAGEPPAELGELVRPRRTPAPETRRVVKQV